MFPFKYPYIMKYLNFTSPRLSLGKSVFFFSFLAWTIDFINSWLGRSS